jgi:acetyltransferase EpsM
MTRRLYIYGAGGHGKVVREAASLQGTWEIAAFVDDAPAKKGTAFLGIPIVASGDVPPGSNVGLAVGRNLARRDLASRLIDRGMKLATIIHPTAVVATDACIGEGSYIGPLAVVHAGAQVGRGCIVNSGAVVEHENVLEDWVHVSCNGTLGGTVTVREGTLIGMGAMVLPGVSVGEWSIIGAGAVVLKPIGRGVTAVGVPAKIIGPVKSDY